MLTLVPEFWEGLEGPTETVPENFAPPVKFIIQREFLLLWPGRSCVPGKLMMEFAPF